MAATVWFNVFPSGEKQSGSTIPAGTHTVSTTVGSPAYNAWDANGAYGGQQVFTGPFPTQQAAANDLASDHPNPGVGATIGAIVSGVDLGLGNASPAAAVQTGQDASNAVSPLIKWPTFTHLRDFVVRAVKVVAGLALVIIGVSKMTGTSKQVIGAAKVAGKAAIL
jgi:hypothetical protein